MMYMHVVFGYGSLINRSSCEKACPVGPLSVARIAGWRRAWNMFSPHSRACYLGVESAPGEWLSGVLFSVDSAGLAALDAREGGYDRLLVPRNHIQGVLPSSVPGAWLYVPKPELTVPLDGLMASADYLRIVFEGCSEVGISWDEFCDTTDDWEFCPVVEGIPTPTRNPFQ